MTGVAAKQNPQHFTKGTNFAFKVKPQEIEGLNEVFISLGIEPTKTKRDQFFDLIEAIKDLQNENTDGELVDKLAELTLDNQALESKIIELKADNAKKKEEIAGLLSDFSVNADESEGTKRLKSEVKQLTQENEDLKSNKPPTNHGSHSKLAVNELLIELPRFHHHLLATVAASNGIQAFNAKQPNNSALYLKLINFEDKKEMMSKTLLNIFVGVFSNYYDSLGHLPEVSDMAKKKDLLAAVAYAKKVDG